MSYLHCKVLVFNFMNLTFTMLCLNDKLKKKGCTSCRTMTVIPPSMKFYDVFTVMEIFFSL